MAQSLDLKSIAEGVENEQQRQFLMDHGCDHFQGYLFGRPMPIDMLEKLITS
jgi:EAL domain-containing protein (putative c-di-GMP-specific phosphodiesterase class I)